LRRKTLPYRTINHIPGAHHATWRHLVQQVAIAVETGEGLNRYPLAERGATATEPPPFEDGGLLQLFYGSETLGVSPQALRGCFHGYPRRRRNTPALQKCLRENPRAVRA
jgi:hypothetical protein